MTPAVFFGVLLVVIGFSIIINVVFKIHIPVVRIIIALLFVFIGIKILLGKQVQLFGKNTASVAQPTMVGSEPMQEYNVVFSKGVVDLRKMEFTNNQPAKVHVNVVFGNCDLILSKDIQYRITSNTAFASVNIPSGNNVVVGSTAYQSEGFDASKPYIDLKLDVVFSNTKLIFF